MKRILTLSILALLLLPAIAGAQGFSVRRMAMGGVILGSRQGGEGANVAYRAVPRMSHGLSSLSLPIGVVQVLNDPPTFDPRNPGFNVFELANLAENPPWNLALTKPTTPSSDISLDVSQNSLRVDLGELKQAFPDGHVRTYGAVNWPSIGFSIRRAFIAVAPLVEYENDLSLNDALTGVLRSGDSIRTNSRYELRDVARAQAAAALHVGLAMPVLHVGDPDKGGSVLYAGVRAKVLRGLAYGQADNVAAVATGDTLFGSQSLSAGYTAHYIDAQPADGGMGLGMDAGVVWTLGHFELGLAVDDIGTSIAWKVREQVAHMDTTTNEIVQTTIKENEDFTSTVPSTKVANAAFHAGGWTLAADVRQNMLATTTHAGIERWLGPLALRAGAGTDSNSRTQLSGGVGIRMGRLGLDVAVATNNRNIEGQRVVELGAGLEVLHR